MEQLIISAVAILGTILAIKFRGLFHKLIAFGIAISVLIVWIDNKYLIMGSFYALLVLTIATVIYGFKVKGLNKTEKISIISMGLFLTLDSYFKLQHLPGVGLIKFSMAVPIIITLISFVKGRKLTREMSFMIFWLVFAFVEFLSLWI